MRLAPFGGAGDIYLDLGLAAGLDDARRQSDAAVVIGVGSVAASISTDQALDARHEQLTLPNSRSWINGRYDLTDIKWSVIEALVPIDRRESRTTTGRSSTACSLPAASKEGSASISAARCAQCQHPEVVLSSNTAQSSLWARPLWRALPRTAVTASGHGAGSSPNVWGSSALRYANEV